MITEKNFGTLPTGEAITCYTLDNGLGLKIEVLNYGCIIKNIFVKNKSNAYTDIVLGRDTICEYLNNEGYFGAVIGRNANRIDKSRITIAGKTYNLNSNDGDGNLHGGLTGFDKKVWSATVSDKEEPSVIFKLRSPDGDENFPGNIDVTVTYTLTKQNGLTMHYEAICDRDTVCNLTNHSYFNLNGHNSGKKIYNHDMQMNCHFFTPNVPECMPNGEILSVKGTPFDFTSQKSVGKDISDKNNEQLSMFGGYDHNFIIDGWGFRKACTLSCADTGIIMDVFTDLPGVQLYTGNCIETGRICKDGAKYEPHSALCLETQFFPNSFSFSHFPSTILKKGEKYDHTTEYRFSVN